jgi:hypothetical protein
MSTCRQCGCTDDDCDRCVARTGAPCWWVEPDLCSACKPDQNADHPEPDIVINGYQLRPGQALSVRVAVSSLHFYLTDEADPPALEPQMLAGYTARINEVLEVMLKPRPAATAHCFYCDTRLPVSQSDAMREHAMTCAKSPVVKELAKALRKIEDQRLLLQIDEEIQQGLDGVCDDTDALVEEHAQLKADHELAVTALATARNDLLRAMPSEDEREVLRWIRELVQRSTEAQLSTYYSPALELLQRLLVAKVSHAA